MTSSLQSPPPRTPRTPPLPPPLRSWSDLPQDLSSLILAQLPPSSAARCRSVSRSWLSNLDSAEFLRLRRRLHAPLPPPTLLLYHHSSKISATSSVSAAASWSDIRLPSPFVREWASDPISGIVCIRTHLAASIQQFLVGRPLSDANSWRPIPNPPTGGGGGGGSITRLWAVAADNSRNRFWVLLLNMHMGKTTVTVFDSESRAWAAVEAPPEEAAISWSSRAEAIGGVVYVVEKGRRSVVMLDVRKGEWRRRRTELPAELAWEAEVGRRKVEATPRVVAGGRRGRLMVAGGGGGGGVALWEEDHGAGKWAEVARPPEAEVAELVAEAAEWRKSEVVPLRFAGGGDSLFILAAGAQRALRLDLARESWSWLTLPPLVNTDLVLCLLPLDGA